MAVPFIQGRNIYINTQGTQTVKICTHLNKRTQYERYYRISAEKALDKNEMEEKIREFVSISALEDWLMRELSAKRETEKEAVVLSKDSIEKLEKTRDHTFIVPKKGKRVFIVHGHDKDSLSEVVEFVEKLGLQALVLNTLPNTGRTIIEKFEDYKNVQYAIVLLTPDDVGGVSVENLHPRARQNVIFEMGYFMSHLGRKHVAVLRKKNTEILSDYQGVLYIPFGVQGEDWQGKLEQEMKEVGLI